MEKEQGNSKEKRESKGGQNVIKQKRKETTNKTKLFLWKYTNSIALMLKEKKANTARNEGIKIKYTKWENIINFMSINRFVQLDKMDSFPLKMLITKTESKKKQKQTIRESNQCFFLKNLLSNHTLSTKRQRQDSFKGKSY